MTNSDKAYMQALVTDFALHTDSMAKNIAGVSESVETAYRCIESLRNRMDSLQNITSIYAEALENGALPPKKRQTGNNE